MNKRNTSIEKRKENKKFPYKVGGKNRTKKISLFLFIMLGVMIFSLAGVSAVDLFTIDNIKQYDEKTKTITVVNTFGLGKDLAQIKLVSDLEVVVETGY